MKITPEQYAISLYETVAGKTASEAGVAVKNFVKLLAANGDIVRADKIMEKFVEIHNKQEGIMEAEAVVSCEAGKTAVDTLAAYVKSASKAKKVLLEVRIDKNILGGTIIRYGDKIIDGSLKTRIGEIKKIILT